MVGSGGQDRLDPIRIGRQLRPPGPRVGEALARRLEPLLLDLAVAESAPADIRLIAFITDPAPIRKILEALGEPLDPPPLAPARGSPAS